MFMPLARLLSLVIIGFTLSACALKAPGVTPTTNDYLQAMPKPTASTKPSPLPPVPSSPVSVSSATLKTNLGDIKIGFYPKPTNTVNNFLDLAQKGFYDGVKWHRVISGFMIQTGDPLSKDDDWSNDGQGGPGYTFADEINDHLLIKGSVAMANAGPNTNGSQFFIITAASTPWLDGKHANFGFVIEGWDTISQIESAASDENDHPLKDIIITGISVE